MFQWGNILGGRGRVQMGLSRDIGVSQGLSPEAISNRCLRRQFIGLGASDHHGRLDKQGLQTGHCPAQALHCRPQLTF